MKKYLDILLFTLLFFFVFSYFFNSQNTTPQTGIQFQTDQKKYKVPAGVLLTLSNYEADPVELDTCTDITVRYEGAPMDIPDAVCDTTTLAKGDSYTIDFSPYYASFEQPWNYIFEYARWENTYIQQVEIEYRWVVGKLFIGIFYQPIYNLMMYLIQMFHSSLGLAIIATTMLIRIMLLYPQHKMLVSQRKMQAIQPKVKKIQQKHKGNQQQMGIELMKLYKEEWVNPMGTCGFLLLQMPFLFVMYNIILNIMSQKNEFYLYSGLSGFHVSQINPYFYGMNLLESGGTQWVILALTVWSIQFIQIKLSLLQTKKDTKDEAPLVLEKKKWDTDYTSIMPDQETMNKFMLYGMPAMVTIFTYTLIAWVWLYWWVSTIFTIFQQLFVNKFIKK